MSPEAASAAANGACNHMLNCLSGLSAPVNALAGYMPIHAELSPLPLLEALAAQGITIALPVITPGTLLLSFHTWKPGELLVNGPFGTAQPSQTATQIKPTVILMPLLAFDDGGHRLGYGGGYYDATLKKSRSEGRGAKGSVIPTEVGIQKKENPDSGLRRNDEEKSLYSNHSTLTPFFAIGYGFALQLSPTPLPSESFDEKLDAVITEEGCTWFT